MNEEHTFRVVVGVDGSPQSLLALEWAVTEARLRHGQLRVVTGWQFPAAAVGMEGLRWELESFQRVARQIQARALKGVDLEGIAVSREIHEGPAASVLLMASKDADLLVVGSRGHGGFTTLLLGSVSNQIAHHATCPVLIIRPKRPAPAPI
ncbi:MULTISPECIES: universal stress protein [Rhodococcus]|uniref:universal stress protein n=2 Tax=Nocardiaceae TaxID=85025 RepID=UPI000C9BD6BF|nr:MULTISPECIES: universal stress protein [Rhodococcus]PND52775.1 universal stress protein [Rhodococcus sp. ENV425]WKX01822.1 universal stress protein [Rhodococcus aetherivorans]